MTKTYRHFGHCVFLIFFALTGGCGGSKPVVMEMALPGFESGSGPYQFYLNGFPSDLRKRADGSIDMADFPRKSHLLTRAYINSVPKITQGYHTVMPVYLPFNGPLDVAALPTWDLDFASAESPIQLIDIDRSSPEYGRRFPLQVSMTHANGDYRPEHLLQVQVTLGVNFRPETTYAVIVLDSMPTKGPRSLAQNEQLGAVLAANARSKVEPAVAQVYQPLRDYLAEQNIATRSIVGASVWTTGQPLQRFYKGAAAVAKSAETLPEIPVGPLELYTEYPEFCVIRGFVEIPGYQKGVVPYLFAGGEIEWDDQGAPIQQYSRQAEFVVTIPKNETMPANGFPIMHYVHGASGRAHQVWDRGEFDHFDVTQFPYYIGKKGKGPSQIAAERGWASSGMAGHISYDHLGRVLSLIGGAIVYSPYNPVGMQGSYYQMAWERIYFRRILDRLTIPADLCPEADPGLAQAFKIDPRMQVNMGQSHGHWVSSLVVAADPKPYQGAIFSGISGTWTKLYSNNEGFRLAMNAIVTNQTAVLDDAHPFLMLMEWLWGSAEPTANLDGLLRYPTKEPPHVLAFSGFMDYFLSEDAQRTVLMSLGVDLVGNDIGNKYHLTLFPHMEIAGSKQLDYPAVNNVVVPGYGERTAVVARYRNNNPVMLYNGHEVTFQREEIKHQYGCFMEHLAQGQAPVIGVGVAQGDPCL